MTSYVKHATRNRVRRGLLASLLVWSFFCLAVTSGDPPSCRAQTSAIKPEAAVAKKAKIWVAPNMLVSRDGDIPHVELMIAANPKNDKNLLGAAITNTRPEGGFACKTYASTDGGYTWTAAAFPEQLEWGGADPQVAFGAHGTAYFSAIANFTDEKGVPHGGLYVYRSEDGGKTWQKPADLGHSYDHPQIAVDHTYGKYAGRIYLGALYGYPVYKVGIFRSDDDGRTFIGPVEASNGGGIVGINVNNLLILSDGTLFVPYLDFEFKPEKREGSHSSNLWFVTSADGGLTFSEPHKINAQEFGTDREASEGITGPVYAVDSQTDAYHNRLYAAWDDVRFGKIRIIFSYSTDRGQTWSEPRPVDGSVPASARQYQPMIAINNQGTVGITWFDTRGAKDGKQYDEYFCASIDGGKTFLPSVRVSSESSIPDSAANMAMTAGAWLEQGLLYVRFASAAQRWGNGGDYMGLTSDAKEIFHPFWADRRTGTFQIQSAAVRVEFAEKHGNEKGKESVSQIKVKTNVTGKVELVYDPVKYDLSSQDLEIPIRLKNVSRETIYGPVSVELNGFGRGDASLKKEETPLILNAANGKQGVGAVFDYQPALGSAESLDPGAESGEVVWRIKVVNPRKIFDLHVTVTGFLEQRK